MKKPTEEQFRLAAEAEAYDELDPAVVAEVNEGRENLIWLAQRREALEEQLALLARTEKTLRTRLATLPHVHCTKDHRKAQRQVKAWYQKNR